MIVDGGLPKAWHVHPTSGPKTARGEPDREGDGAVSLVRAVAAGQRSDKLGGRRVAQERSCAGMERSVCHGGRVVGRRGRERSGMEARLRS